MERVLDLPFSACRFHFTVQSSIYSAFVVASKKSPRANISAYCGFIYTRFQAQEVRLSYQIFCTLLRRISQSPACQVSQLFTRETLLHASGLPLLNKACDALQLIREFFNHVLRAVSGEPQQSVVQRKFVLAALASLAARCK